MPTPRDPRTPAAGKLYQSIAIAICILLGLAMILNTQLGGEAMWFWYTTVFHHGVKLYSGLHMPLQPLFILEMDAWMTMFGTRNIVVEIPSVFHLVILSLGFYFILRESAWKDWQKAFVLLGAFMLTVGGHSYRFDDYHVTTETFILYSLLLLLIIARTEDVRRQFGLIAVLGLLSGFAITTRLNDGVALLTAGGFSLLFLARSRKFVSLCCLGIIAALTVLLVVRLTGDTFPVYISSTLIRAAASKGGAGSLAASPFHMFANTVKLLYEMGKRGVLVITIVAAFGYYVQRYQKPWMKYLVWLQVAVLVVALAVIRVKRLDLLNGLPISIAVLLFTPLMYLVAPIALGRFVLAKIRHQEWNSREILAFLPLAIWASYSAGAAAEPLTNYYAPVALFLLLVPVIQPFRRFASWATPSFVIAMGLVGISGISAKILVPYQWQDYSYSPMFVNRQWYNHPVYGPMYIDRDLLQFSRAVCADIGQPHPELLSLPYPYPNYFCDATPWRNYVQTFFDTSTRATVEHMMNELNTAPPQWIVYQRQLFIMRGAERLYNHGQRLAQRDLDDMIMQKIATGQWTLVDKKDYLQDPEGGGWYIIRTHP